MKSSRYAMEDSVNRFLPSLSRSDSAGSNVIGFGSKSVSRDVDGIEVERIVTGEIIAG
jgi:hypothetical protein